jgi:four helix bundle protein
MHPKTIALQERTHTFFVRVVRLCEQLPQNIRTQRIQEQLVDSAGGTDSNYGSACRARSKAEFIAKMGTAVEEADESLRWLRALLALNCGDKEETQELIREADELTAIFVASRKTAERRLDERNRQLREARLASRRR